MATFNDEPAIYAAEQEAYLAQARRRGLLSNDDSRRMRVAYGATARRTRGSHASVLPRLLLDAQDGGRVLTTPTSAEQAGARWSLYERLREQTQHRRAASTAGAPAQPSRG
jgi:hypothetical protein